MLIEGERVLANEAPSWRALAAVKPYAVHMGAQLSSAPAQEADPQSSMRPGWPMGEPPDMNWGEGRGLQETLQACARTHPHRRSRPAHSGRSAQHGCS